MKNRNDVLLRGLVFFAIAVTAIIWLVYLIGFRPWNDYPQKGLVWFLIPKVTALLILGYSLIIAVRGTQQHSYWMALFLAMLGQNYGLNYLSHYFHGTYLANPDATASLVNSLHSTLTGWLFMRAMQFFPHRLTPADANLAYHRNRLFRAIVKWSLKPSGQAIIAAALFVSYFLRLGLSNEVILISISALCLYAGFRSSQGSGRNKVLWFFCGVVVYLVVMSSFLLIRFFNASSPTIVGVLMVPILNIVLLATITMSLFFFDSFDTGTVVKRTIADSVTFLGIVLLYNMLEHYVLHWASEKLELSDALVSSFFSAILVTTITPLHHRLMNYVEAKVKKTAQHSH